MVQIRTGSVSAFLAAGFLAASAILSSLVRFGAVGDPIPNVNNFNSTFDPDYLLQKWLWQRSTFSPTLVADFFAMVGLILLVLTAQQLRKVFRSHNGVAHRAMFYCFAFGGFLPAIAFLQDVGATSMADWMADPLSDWKVSMFLFGSASPSPLVFVSLLLLFFFICSLFFFFFFFVKRLSVMSLSSCVPWT